MDEGWEKTTRQHPVQLPCSQPSPHICFQLPLRVARGVKQPDPCSQPHVSFSVGKHMLVRVRKELTESQKTKLEKFLRGHLINPPVSWQKRLRLILCGRCLTCFSKLSKASYSAAKLASSEKKLSGI